MNSRIPFFCALLFSILTFQTADAVEREEREFARGFNNKLNLRPTVKPSFHVAPMSHHFSERRGKLIPFQFEIESVDRATTVNVQMVALKQDLTGTILPDTDSPAPSNVRLLSPAQMKLANNEKNTIKCQVRVPNTKANFHSFGILVTDLGRIVDRRPVSASDNVSRRVGIKFVTRYMLRVDIAIKGARGEEVSKVEVQSAKLVEDNGFAKAEVLINNPTDGPLEFRALCRLLRNGSAVGKTKFNLVAPNRFNLEDDSRNDIRILPGATIRIEEFVPTAVFPGNHELEIDFVTQRRSKKKEVLPITIRQGDFPAQDASLLQPVRDVTIGPAAVELSLRKGGKRMRTVELQNNSQQEIKVEIRNTGAETIGESWLMIRPTELTIRPGSKRRVMMMANPKIKVDSSRYATTEVNIKNASGDSVGVMDLPVALIARSEEKPVLKLDPIAWDGQAAPPCFVVPVKNMGAIHTPLRAKLSVVDAFGRIVDMEAGYGRWALPGQKTELRFRTKFAPPPGTYRCKLTIEGDESMEPIVLESNLNFGDTETEGAKEIPIELGGETINLNVGE